MQQNMPTTNKFQYNEELKTFLTILYKELIKYLGSENAGLIAEALSTTPIIFTNNVHRSLMEEEMLEESFNNQAVQKSDFERSSGAHSSKAIIKYNQALNTFELESVKHVIIINAKDLNSVENKAALIHELSHLLKSFYLGYQIVGDILVERSGLMEKYYRLSYENNQVIKKFIGEKAVGLEEGLTAVMEKDLVRTFVDPEYEVTGYATSELLARRQCEEYHLRNELLNAELFGRKEELIQFYDTKFFVGAYAKLEDIMERLYKLELQSYQYDPISPEFDQINNQIQNVLLEAYWPFIDQIEESLENKK